MIKINNSSLQVSGSKEQLMVEVTVLIQSLVENGFDWEDIETCVETAKMSPEELEQARDDLFKKFIESLLGGNL